MKGIGKKLAALALALSLALGLTACGDKDGKNGGDSQTISGTVYVPTFTGVTSAAEYISQGCVSGEYLYFTGSVQGEEHEETSFWVDENGEEHADTYTYYDYRTGLFRVPLTGGAAEELPNFQAMEIPEGADGSSDIGNLRAGEDGTLWITENLYVNNFDLPEDFDEATDSKWNYYVDDTSTTILRQLDAEGNQLSSSDLSGLAEKAGLEYNYGVIMDASGNIYTNSDTTLAVLDKDMNLLFSLEGEQMWGQLILLSDGSVGLYSSYYDEERQVSGNRLNVVDLTGQAWGASYELSQSSYEVYPGGGDYLFYYRNGDSIYGRKAGSAEGERVFSWIGADIDESSVQFFSFLPDGRVAAMTRDWSGDSPTYEMAMLTPTDASTLPQKTTLTYACMGLNWDVRTQIIDFNKSSDLYRIEVTDYNEYNTGDDNTAGLTKMNTEILAGHVPDILEASSSVPISQYGSKGLLEDLWPYIEADQEIGGREGVMENVLKAAEQDGKLYRVFKAFDIRTVVGASSVVGQRTSWTMDDLQAALAQMPEGCSIFGVTDTKEGMLSTILACNMDSFVDWSTGECHFDSDSFKSLLEFCNSFPEEFNWDNVDWDKWEEEDQRVMTGKQMLENCYLDGFTSVQRYKAVFGGDISFVGYPMEDGSVGSAFQIINDGFAMSSTSKNKEGVWSFIRQTLLSESEEAGDEYRTWDFPVNRKDFEKYMEFATTETYILDENGEPYLDENGEPMKEAKASYYIYQGGSTEVGPAEEWVEVYAIPQEDVDQIMDLYNSITGIWSYDTSIYEIVQENVGGYFAGDRSVDDTAARIQSAVKLYIGEQM